MTNPFLLSVFCLSVYCLTVPNNSGLQLNFHNALDTPPSDHINNGSLSFQPSSWDPRLQLDSFTAEGDLSDKSSYMTCMKAIRDLSLQEYTQYLISQDFLNPSYGDVVIPVAAVSPPRLETRHVMWTIIAALRFLERNSFQPVKYRMYWVERNQAALLLGELSIEKNSGQPTGLMFGGNTTAMNQTGPAEVTQETTTNRVQLLSNSSESDNEISIGQNLLSSLDAGPRRKVFFDFEGARLPKVGVFESLAGCVVSYAQKPRHPFLFTALEMMLSDGTVKIAISKFDASVADRSIIYDDLMWMFYNLPRAMYKDNKFREGTFILEVNKRPLVKGKIDKIRGRPLTGGLNGTSVAVS